MEENKLIRQRLEQLRNRMKESQVEWCYITTGDYHNSEYVTDYFNIRDFFSNFSGSNGTLVLSMEFAGLWTDGRYFIQAEGELAGTGIKLFRMLDEGVPTIPEFFKESLNTGDTIGFDGRIVSATLGQELAEIAKKSNGSVCAEFDPAEGIWTAENGRPMLPCTPVKIIKTELSGISTSEKLEQIRADLKKEKTDALFLSKLDDLMWLFNIRGNDVPCNPVVLCHAFLTMEQVVLFIQKNALTREAVEYFENMQVQMREYSEVSEFLKNINNTGHIMLDPKNVSYLFLKNIEEKQTVVKCANPTELKKSVKNEIERKNLREIYLKDSVAVTKFIYQIKKNTNLEETNEFMAAMLMDEIRMQIPECFGLSFPTICGYQANAAMMHYQADAQNAATLQAEGMLLVDSGGQYDGGTTDVTRTISLGRVSEQQKEHYTRVSRGMLNLSNAKFLYGCTGRNLDIIARQPLWEAAIDYKCGTGHGIGYMLNVHEGPQSIRWQYNQSNHETVLEEGMLLSNEPGVYLAGEYGIRIENIMLCKKGPKNSDGQFMEFETLTFVPLELDAVMRENLNRDELERLNSYHKQVYEKISPFLEEEERQWLLTATQII